MSLTPKMPAPPAAAPSAPDMTPARQRLGSENPTSANLKAKKKGRGGLRIDLQHGGNGLSVGATGVNIPTA